MVQRVGQGSRKMINGNSLDQMIHQQLDYIYNTHPDIFITFVNQKVKLDRKKKEPIKEKNNEKNQRPKRSN